MHPVAHQTAFFAASVIASLTLAAPASADDPTKINSAYVSLPNGVEIHYLVAGKGDPVILLHGFAQTSHMWLPLIPELAKTHLVIAPDLRGFGFSSKPDGGYDKKTMAQDVHALVTGLGLGQVGVAGHDIGLMV